MLEELLDLVAVGGGAGLVVAGGGMHQQSHGALQLLLPLLTLRLGQSHLQLIDAPHLSLCAAGALHHCLASGTQTQSGMTDGCLALA